MAQQVLDGIEALSIVYDDIQAAFAHVNYIEPLENFMPELEKAHSGFLDGQHAPDGDPWAALRPSTVKRKGHDVIWFETGRTGASLVGQTGDSIRQVFREGADNQHSLVYGTSVEYAGYVDGGTTKMPPRRLVGLNEPLLDSLCNSVAEATVEGMKLEV